MQAEEGERGMRKKYSEGIIKTKGRDQNNRNLLKGVRIIQQQEMVKIQEQRISGTGQRPKNVPFTILSADLNESSLLTDEKKMVKSQTIVR